jgi:putative hydrolase of the HAD superfamily
MHDGQVTAAVIFDLFGTLTGFESLREGQTAILADVLGVPVAELPVQLRETYDERARGVLGDVRDQIVTLTRGIGSSPSEGALDRAVEIRMQGQWAVMQPRPGALEVLSELRARGLKIGVLSDCTNEIPILWPSSVYAGLVDAAVFSCLLGVRKPDQRTYAAVLSGLHVEADLCFYVGDGGSSELSGALKAGLRPVLLDVVGEDHFRYDHELDWSGESIASLSDVLTLVDAAGPLDR